MFIFSKKIKFLILISLHITFLSLPSFSTQNSEKNKENVHPCPPNIAQTSLKPENKKSILADCTPLSNHEVNFDKAVRLSRQASKTSEKKKHYMCALPNKKTAQEVEKLLQGSLGNRALPKRQPTTVANFALNEWSEERPSHMTLMKTAPEQEKNKLLEILKKVEFKGKEIDLFGRFIVIFLDKPTVRNDHILTPEEEILLNQYLEHTTDLATKAQIPCMHLSMIKVNDIKKQMECIKAGKNEAEILITEENFNQSIKMLQCKSSSFSLRIIEKALSEISLYYIYIHSEDARQYISQVSEEKKNKLVSFIEKKSDEALRAFLHFPLMAKYYFSTEYGLNYNFTDNIGIKTPLGVRYNIDENSVHVLFSQIFLDSIEENNKILEKNFIKYQNFVKFYIKSTIQEIERKKSEISEGRANVSADANMWDFFEVEKNQLSEEEKILYQNQNNIDE